MTNENTSKNPSCESRLNPSSSFEAFDKVSGTKAPLEPFVAADVVAEFLGITRRQVLDWARANVIPAHPLGCCKKRIWRFRLSEITADVLSRHPPRATTMPSGSPRSQRRKI
jgi:hypothetical protein